jgi:hypothetical protein
MVYLALGVAFILEGLEVWILRIGDLRYAGPLTLVVVGLAIVVGGVQRTAGES